MLVDLGVVRADAQVAAVLVPAQDPAPPPGKGEEFGKASPIALVVIILLGVATVLLIVSMTRRLKRLPTSFDEADAAPDDVRPEDAPKAEESQKPEASPRD